MNVHRKILDTISGKVDVTIRSDVAFKSRRDINIKFVNWSTVLDIFVNRLYQEVSDYAISRDNREDM